MVSHNSLWIRAQFLTAKADRLDCLATRNRALAAIISVICVPNASESLNDVFLHGRTPGSCGGLTGHLLGEKTSGTFALFLRPVGENTLKAFDKKDVTAKGPQWKLAPSIAPPARGTWLRLRSVIQKLMATRHLQTSVLSGSPPHVLGRGGNLPADLKSTRMSRSYSGHRAHKKTAWSA